MGRLMIVRPLPIAAIGASRGSVAANLATPDPKEVWADTDTGTATITVDLGSVVSIDTVFLGFVWPLAATATWSITAGIASAAEFTMVSANTMRVPDVPGSAPLRSHALWSGETRTARYVAVTTNQPVGSGALSAGVVVIGKAFTAKLGQEWGGGRQPIDLSSVTELPSGGFSVVEAARKRALKWTFGDLTADEAEQLELIAMELGESKPVLVVEDPAATTGLRARIHYGLFNRWAAFERRNPRQTRWEVGIREWV